MPKQPGAALTWVVVAFLSMFENPVGLQSSIVAGLLLFIAGCISLLRRNRAMAVMLIVPFLAVLCASAVRKYPFQERLILFLVPLALILVGEGIDKFRLLLLKVSSRVATSACVVVAAFLFYGPVGQATSNLFHPDLKEHIRPVMEHLKQQRKDGDYIYLYYSSFSPFTYYAPLYGFQETDYQVGIRNREQPEKYFEDVSRATGHARSWFVFSHVFNWHSVDEEAYILEHLNKTGTQLDRFRAPGASVYLYSFPVTKAVDAHEPQ